MGGIFQAINKFPFVDPLTQLINGKILGGDSKSSDPPPAPPPPTMADPSVQQAEKDAQRAAANAKGRASTMLLNPAVSDAEVGDDETKTAKKYLLGS